MAVLSKLLYEVMPKTVTGWVLCMVPIAAAVVLVMFPKTVVQALMPSESVGDALGEEETEETIGAAAGKAKVTGKDVKRKRRPPRNQKVSRKDGQARDEQAIKVNPQGEELLDEVLTDEEDSLLKLASIQSKMTPGSGKAAQNKTAIPQSPVLSALSLSNEGDDGKWSRVPTKQEEAITNLKSRIATITHQLEESEHEAADLRSKLDKERTRAAEAENELKDRSRSYQLRWVEMETEISNLKGAKEQLMKRLSESLSAQDVTLKQRDDTISSLKERVAELEVVSSSVPLLKKHVTGHEETEKALREQISRLETDLSQALEMEEQLKKERNQAEGKLEALQQQLDSLQKEKEMATTEVSSFKDQLSQTMSSMTAAKEQVQSLQVSLDHKSEEVEKLREELNDLVAAKDEASSLLEKLKSKEAEISILQDALSKAEDEKKVLERAASSASDREAVMTKDLVQLNETISEVQKQKDDLAAQLATTSDKDDQIAKLTLNLETLQEERDRLKGDLERIGAETRELKERLDQENSARLVAAEEVKKEAEAKVVALQDEISKLRTELSEITEKLAAVETQAQTKSASSQEEAAAATSTLQAALEASQRERAELAAQLEQIEHTVKQHLGDLEKAEKKNSILQSVMDMKVSSLKEEINALREERDSLASKLAGFAQSTEMLDRLVDESSSANPSKDDDSVPPAAVPSV